MIYSEEESERTISWMHQSFGNVGDLDRKILGFTKNPIFDSHAGCLCIGCMYTWVGCV
jgi:hypothetical protein